MAYRLDPRLEAFLVRVEGERLASYQDTTGKWTIGVGHTGPEVQPGLTITTAQSRAYLAKDVELAEKAVLYHVKAPLTEHQRFALVSFVFNLGASRLAGSTLLRKLNTGDYDSVVGELMRWNKETVNGVLRESAGLTNRRAAEVELWNMAKESLRPLAKLKASFGRLFGRG